MWPVILQIGPLTIYSFGTMAALACLAAGWVTEKEMRRRGLPGDVAWSIAVWGTLIGFLASAVWYFFQHHFIDLLTHPLGTAAAGIGSMAESFRAAQGNLVQRLLATFAGCGSGFVWYGGFIGGTLAVTWIIRRHQLPWLKTVDCLAPALALAHGIGRIGCQLAGDGDWGVPSDLPWAMAYPNAIVGWHDQHGNPYPPEFRVHPTPIYEMLAYFAVFAVLWRMRKRPHADGALLWWYLVLSSAARFVIEFWRINPPVAFGLTVAQLTSLLLIAIGALALVVTRGAVEATAAGVPQPARR